MVAQIYGVQNIPNLIRLILRHLQLYIIDSNNSIHMLLCQYSIVYIQQLVSIFLFFKSYSKSLLIQLYYIVQSVSPNYFLNYSLICHDTKKKRNESKLCKQVSLFQILLIVPLLCNRIHIIYLSLKQPARKLKQAVRAKILSLLKVVDKLKKFYRSQRCDQRV